MDPQDVDYAIKRMRTNVGFEWIPLIKISAQDGISLPVLMKTIRGVFDRTRQRLDTSGLNKILQRAWLTKPPRFPKNKICKRKYITQVESDPPTFMLSVNNKAYANFSFKRWVEKVIR